MSIRSFSGCLFQLSTFDGFYHHHGDGRINNFDCSQFFANDLFICVGFFALNEYTHFDVYFTRVGFVRISRHSKFKLGDDFKQIL